MPKILGTPIFMRMLLVIVFFSVIGSSLLII
jgi:hypothetical protein